LLKFIGAVTCVGFVALVLVVLFAVGGSHGSSSGPSGDSDSATLGPAMRVSAMKLALDYHANEVQADNVYRGKHLLVTGLVTSISKDAFDKIYLVLASENEFMQVHANLQEGEAGAAATLHTMQLVHVDCVGGEMVIGSPQLNNCTIVPDEPVAAPPAPSEPQASAEPSPSDESSKPTPSGPATDEATGTSKDSADADSSSGDTQEGQAPQQPPAPIERH
jgi:tRNA_anti-like